MYVSQDFDFKNDIVINVGNAADRDSLQKLKKL